MLLNFHWYRRTNITGITYLAEKCNLPTTIWNADRIEIRSGLVANIEYHESNTKSNCHKVFTHLQ